LHDYTYIYVLVIIALATLISIIKRSNYLEKRKNAFFILAALSDMLILLGYVGRDVSQQNTNIPLAHASSMLTYLCAPMCMFFLIFATSPKTDLILITCCVLEAISVIIALSSPFTEWFYHISQYAVYSRGPLYIYNEILGILFVVIWAIYSFREFYYIEFVDKLCLSELFLLQIFAIVFQGINSTYKVIYICGAFVLMLYYAFVIEVYGKYDKMTGVRNRLYYQNFIVSKRAKEISSVIMFDINGLKKTNDTLGHEAGDILICTIATAILKAVGRNGSVYRIGGDEFIAVLRTDSTMLIDSIETSTDIIVSEAQQKSDLEISVSHGSAIRFDNEKLSETIKRADCKMYENKRNFYSFANKEE
jgi:diguanylate cyclase (GGDEF)-like protein